MKVVCTHCRSAYDIELEVSSQVTRDYVTLKCLICGSNFDVLIKSFVAPKSHEKVYLIPRIMEKSKTQLIYENWPSHIRDEI